MIGADGFLDWITSFRKKKLSNNLITFILDPNEQNSTDVNGQPNQ